VRGASCVGRGSWVAGHVGRFALAVVVVGPVTGHWSPVTAQQAAPQRGGDPATSVTLYQDGRVLVRRAFPIRVASGASTQRVPLGPVDPSSLVSLDTTVAITGAVTVPGADQEGALRAAVGRSIVFRLGPVLRDTISAVVLGVDPIRVRLADGTIFFGLPGQPTFPADLVASAATTELRLSSRRGADRLRLGGFAQGGGWNAMYSIILRGTSAQVNGLASFASPFQEDDVEVQLLAGQVNQAPAPSGPIGQFHLYTLGGRHQLRPGVLTSVALFEPATAPIAKSYEVRSSVPFWGYWGQTGDEGETPVAVYYTLQRARRTPFGETPLPQGAVRIFEADSAGRMQMIGEAGVGHTAAGEELRINAGSAFDLVAKRIQTDYQTGQEPIPGAPRRTRTFVNAAYADTLRNQGATEAVIDVMVERGGEWRIVESSIPAERLSNSKYRFRVRVPARSEALLTYRIRSSW
jgi:hypothetical protein